MYGVYACLALRKNILFCFISLPQHSKNSFVGSRIDYSARRVTYSNKPGKGNEGFVYDMTNILLTYGLHKLLEGGTVTRLFTYVQTLQTFR